MSKPLVITSAKPEWAWCLTSVAHASKAYWGYPVSWLNSWSSALTLTPAYIQSHDTAAAFWEGRLAGFFALVERGDVFELSHLWVLPNYMRKGIGRALFAEASTRARNRGAMRMTIEADPNAAAFYQRCGAKLTSYAHSKIFEADRKLPVFELTL